MKILLGGKMQSRFDITAWLLQTVLLTGLFLLLIPVARTFLGLTFIAIGNGLSMKNQHFRSIGIKMLPTFIRGLVGVGVGFGALMPTTSFADPGQLVVVQPSTARFQTVEVQPGDSLWSIAMAQLFAANQNVKVGEVDNAWRQIWLLNKNQIGEDPSQLKAGMKIQIPNFYGLPNVNS